MIELALICFQERQRLMEENERLAVLVDNANEDVRHVTELLDKTDKEKKRLSEKNAQLTVNGMNHLLCYLPPLILRVRASAFACFPSDMRLCNYCVLFVS